jgi:hypothetical protein
LHVGFERSLRCGRRDAWSERYHSLNGRNSRRASALGSIRAARCAWLGRRSANTADFVRELTADIEPYVERTRQNAG